MAKKRLRGIHPGPTALIANRLAKNAESSAIFKDYEAAKKHGDKAKQFGRDARTLMKEFNKVNISKPKKSANVKRTDRSKLKK